MVSERIIADNGYADSTVLLQSDAGEFGPYDCVIRVRQEAVNGRLMRF